MSGAPPHDEHSAGLSFSPTGFLKCWFRTRQLGLLLQGLPAVALAVILGGLLVSSGQPATSATIDTYLSRAKSAIAVEDYEQAEFCFRKLQLLAPDSSIVIDARAELAIGQANWLEAVRLREMLLEDGESLNDGTVHKWLARTALEQDLGLESPLDYARSHLDAVLAENPHDREAHFFFARLHLLQGDLGNAIAHLEPIAALDPRFQLQLATLYLQRQPPDDVRARSNARSAAGILRKEIDTTQVSNLNKFHQLAAAEVILGNFEPAIQTLRQAITRFDQDATRKQIARVYVAWSDDVRKKSPEDLGRQLQLLQEALQTAPDEPAVLQRLLEIASAEGDGAAEAESALRTALVNGAAPAAVHFSLGTLAAKRGDLEAAMRHFEQSEEANPKTAVTLNNMAYIMARMPDSDLNQALELANQAVRMAPRAAPFRETRGQILVRLEKWTEAITDLEYANARMPGPTSRLAIQRSLAAAYRGLGDDATADAYQQKAEQLARQLSATQSAPAAPTEFDFDRPRAEGDTPSSANDSTGSDASTGTGAVPGSSPSKSPQEPGLPRINPLSTDGAANTPGAPQQPPGLPPLP